MVNLAVLAVGYFRVITGRSHYQTVVDWPMRYLPAHTVVSYQPEEGVMSPRRLISLGSLLLFAFALVSCSSSSPSGPDADNSIEVDLSTFPESGNPVPDHTVLAGQWASIGIIFDAEPEWVDPVKETWGEAHIFFSPDTEGVIAVFSFVEPGTMDPVDITAFELRPWFNAGESAELVGLDEGGAEVVIDTVTPADIGDEAQTIKMSIEGNFRTVEWRTHGDPGIAAYGIVFEF